jgi:flagellar biosynthesis/type III secretory pathway M-ring protein FliF/YscJ
VNLEGVVNLITAGGGSIVLVALITGIFKVVTGRAGREREDNASAETQRVRAVEERNTADKRANLAESHSQHSREYVARLRRQLLEAGIEPLSDPNPPTSES